jgi:hypothetical protein
MKKRQVEAEKAKNSARSRVNLLVGMMYKGKYTVKCIF